MAKTFTAPFAQTLQTATINCSTAITNITTDAPGNTTLLVTAGADGAIVTRIWAIPRATVTASSLVLFLSKDGGTTIRMIDSILMGAQTVSTTAAIVASVFSSYSEATPLRLAAADRLYVGSQVALASGIIFRAEFTDF